MVTRKAVAVSVGNDLDVLIAHWTHEMEIHPLEKFSSWLRKMMGHCTDFEPIFESMRMK